MNDRVRFALPLLALFSIQFQLPVVSPSLFSQQVVLFFHAMNSGLSVV